MTRTSVDDAIDHGDLLRLREPVRGFLVRTGVDPHDVEDLVQETLLRVWEVRGRVERRVATAYAVATARNLVQSRRRSDAVHARHAHRLHEPLTVDGPELAALRREERAAAAAALAGLPDPDRELLTEAYGDAPSPVAETSARRRTRLARARSRARVDYLLRLRRLALPTAQCRPVLDALSSGDRREQERAGAAEHLAVCDVCGSCAEALLTRRRGMFGVVALPFLLLLDKVKQAPRTSATVAATAAAATAVVVGVAVHDPAPVARQPVPPAPSAPAVPAAPAALQLAAAPTFSVALAPALGRPVLATDVPVLSVPADEGFWVGPDDGHRFFVHLTSATESPVVVRAGDRVSFRGTVAPLSPAGVAGVDPAEGLAALQAQGALLEVAAADVVVRPG